MNESLARKLRLPAEGELLIMNPPDGYLEELELGDKATRYPELGHSCDFVQVFVHSVREVDELAPTAIRAIKEDGLLWFCYPKGGAKAGTDLNRDKGWDTVKALGYEGVSLIAIDDKWSAMRYRPMGAVGSVPRKSRNTGNPAQKAVKLPAAPELMPADLQTLLGESAQAAAFFAGLAPSHRKAYIQWIEEAKRPETREARVRKTIEKLTQGLKRP
ncbi:YdeI/OmpD-associated family protein [Paenibacillus sp. YPG26]|uniref:YdeI/OmpD-associated family protein n=1 Tax=Paenibacillus sp. YPG26 TaxID=2878915 RepID=UPI00203E5053|nr:YdeI/OmpD-associated family protein [Paenibacillus sp. YPG26]USB34303.1 YdeI/OmpD-associated family protein [Paenibacillus sp. YPG26]